MRLLGQKSRNYKEKSYFKHWVIVPNKLIEKLGWKVGTDLEMEIKKGKLVIEKD